MSHAACRFAVVLLVVLTCRSSCFAQQTPPSLSEPEEPLTEKAYDPTAKLTQFQIKDIYTPAQYGTNAQPNTLQIRPILAVQPFSFIPFEQLIRPTIRMVTVPNGKGASTSTAYDDMQLLDLFVMPWPDYETIRFRWGVGPYLVLPTSTSDRAGRGAWQIGPAVAFGYRGIPRLQIAGLLQQATSFAYTSSRSEPVSSLTFQPILSFRLERGWYLKSSDSTWTINFRHNTSTTIPMSAGFGKVWKLSPGFAIDTSLSGQWTVYRQFSNGTEQSTVNFQVSFLFPRTEL